MANSKTPKDIPNLYPKITIERITNPNKFYAFPIIGGLAKFIILIPVFIDFFAISVAACFLQFINSFFVLFTGKYWVTSYEVTLGLMRLSLKISFFLSGLTNKYPGFDLQINDNFSLNMDMPKNPSRFFAIPILGGLTRIIILIPYFVYTSVIQSASNIATIASSFVVLFKGYYPETTYELNRDGVRLSQSTTAYTSGFSDNYPSFWISMNHKNMKIFLIIVGIIWTLISNIFRFTSKPHQYQNSYNQYNYQNPQSSKNTY